MKTNVILTDLAFAFCLVTSFAGAEATTSTVEKKPEARAGASATIAAAGGMKPNVPGERPVELIARDLGVTPEQFREAFKHVTPARKGEQPTEAQRKANRKVLSEKLGVAPEKLDEVMDRYRPEGKTGGKKKQ